MNSYKSIIVLLGTIMLLSCKNDIKKVNALTDRKTLPEMSGENMEMIYSDSARINIKLILLSIIKFIPEKKNTMSSRREFM